MSINQFIDIALLILLANQTIKIWTLQKENRQLWRGLRILTEISQSNAKSIKELFESDKKILNLWEEFLKGIK